MGVEFFFFSILERETLRDRKMTDREDTIDGGKRWRDSY